MDTDELKRTRQERDTARRVAAEAMRHLNDDQLLQVREALDKEDEHDGGVLRACSGDE